MGLTEEYIGQTCCFSELVVVLNSFNLDTKIESHTIYLPAECFIAIAIGPVCFVVCWEYSSTQAFIQYVLHSMSFCGISHARITDSLHTLNIFIIMWYCCYS